MNLLLMVSTVLYFSARRTISSIIDHSYNTGDEVPLFAHKVGPLNNPSETYEYFSLPFCQPDKLIQRKESPWEILNISHLVNTRYQMRFMEQKEEVLCNKTISRNEVSKFRNAIARDFYFQMYYDDLPFWGFVGKVEPDDMTSSRDGPRYYLFSHTQFNVLYNGNHVIEVHAFGDPNHVVDITEDAEIDAKFSYSVKWKAASVQFQNRMERYSQTSSLPPLRQLHWFSLLNSVVITLLTIGAFMVIHHLSLKSGLTSGDEEGGKEVSWVVSDTDVAKSSLSISLLCALLGCGAQLLTLICCLFILAFLGFIHPYNFGALGISVAVIYNLTSLIAGYTAASLHCQFAETHWIRSVYLTGFLYTGPLSIVVLLVNSIAKSNGISSALPSGTFGMIFLVYIGLMIPSLFLGGIIGHHSNHRTLTSSTRRSPRGAHPLNWYGKSFQQTFLSGLLLFSVILVELHQFFLSLWSYKIYTNLGALSITFAILVMLTIILSVGWTCIQLCADSNQWWWRSILHGGSASALVFFYGLYFYCRSSMNGFLQFSTFLGFNFCICYGFFLMLSAISFGASLIFIQRTCHAVKSE